MIAALLCLMACSSFAAPLSDPSVSYGYNALRFGYGAGHYRPYVAHHRYYGNYVNGYGPSWAYYYY